MSRKVIAKVTKGIKMRKLINVINTRTGPCCVAYVALQVLVPQFPECHHAQLHN
jgi:hypothetical protein